MKIRKRRFQSVDEQKKKSLEGMYADILSRLFQIKKGVIINKTHVVLLSRQLTLCTRFDKKSSEFIVNKKCTNRD